MRTMSPTKKAPIQLKSSMDVMSSNFNPGNLVGRSWISVDGGVCCSEVYRDEATLAGDTILLVLLYCGNVCVYGIIHLSARA